MASIVVMSSALIMKVSVRTNLARSESTLARLRALCGLSTLDWAADGLRACAWRFLRLVAASSLSNSELLVGDAAGCPASCGDAAGAAAIGDAATGVATAGGPADGEAACAA